MFCIADDRVADWPLMSAYWPTFALTALYLVTVYFGPKLMNSRPPFEFRWTLFLYNAGLVVLNFHICFEVGLFYSLLIVMGIFDYGIVEVSYLITIAQISCVYNYQQKLNKFLIATFVILIKRSLALPVSFATSYLYFYHWFYCHTIDNVF